VTDEAGVRSATGPGSVLVISSHVIRGSVGNRAAVFALETLGFPVWALPTVVLPWHPGHGRATRMVFSADDFEHCIDDLIASPFIGEIKAVLTGYFGNASQVLAVNRLVHALRLKNPDLFYLCDPVIGDRGGLYVPQATAQAIRDHLLPLASLATPNRYELAWLTGREPDSNNDLMEAALALGPSRVLVTTAFALMAGNVANLYLSGRNALLAEHRMIENPPNGPGDLLSAVFLARLLGGAAEEVALQKATSSVFEILASTVKHGENELTLERDASSLSSPMAMVHMRTLLHPSARKPK
jgi:pyridoxine kinase